MNAELLQVLTRDFTWVVAETTPKLNCVNCEVPTSRRIAVRIKGSLCVAPFCRECNPENMEHAAELLRTLSRASRCSFEHGAFEA